jgi:PPOX class probable F420-dependent enzyme
MQIDTSTEFGARVARRLRDETVMWLTTVRADGTPDPSPIWFHWDGESFLIYSQPNTPKLRNIERSPNVALNFDGNGTGGDIIIFNGQARIAPDEPPAHQVPDYAAKYTQGFQRIGMTPEQFSQAYSIPIRVTPTRVRGH